MIRSDQASSEGDAGSSVSQAYLGLMLTLMTLPLYFISIGIIVREFAGMSRVAPTDAAAASPTVVSADGPADGKSDGPTNAAAGSDLQPGTVEEGALVQRELTIDVTERLGWGECSERVPYLHPSAPSPPPD